ncbi:unnamed protein product [Peniophora sp. CBMAI 1063]|nr:unnamed protein product [Peniophora sp. CBMAI 1063]
MSSEKVPTHDDSVVDRKSPCTELLYATIPNRTTRYDEQSPPHESPRGFSLKVAEHLFTNMATPAYSAGEDWSFFVHPEGKGYWIKLIQGVPVISELNMKELCNKEAAQMWAAFILKLAGERDLKLSVSTELWMSFEVDTCVCDYYFADHNSRAIFWLETVDTDVVGLPSAYSERHLAFALASNYWKHVEMFCMHLVDNAPGEKHLIELTFIIVHARADMATSDSSTWPFTAEVTDVYLDLLRRCRELPYHPVMYAFVGRLWVFVSDYRFTNFHGEEVPRLDVTSSVLEHTDEEPSILFQLMSAVLLFGQPEAVRRELSVQLVDGLVVDRVWTAFISDKIKEWRKLMQWTLVLVLASAAATAVSPIPIITYTSLAVSSVCLLLCALLPQRLQGIAKDIDGTCEFLAGQNGRMVPLAIVFSLPRAAFIWSLILLAAQAMIILFTSVPLPAGITICVVTGLLALYLAWIMYPVQRLALYHKITEFRLPRLCFWRRTTPKIPDVEAGFCNDLVQLD